MTSIMLSAASPPTLAKNARMGHPHSISEKEEQSVEKAGPAPKVLRQFLDDVALS
jgi:hypothetical protein